MGGPSSGDKHMAELLLHYLKDTLSDRYYLSSKERVSLDQLKDLVAK